VLAYQRRQKHTEQRLGGLWSVGFGGHIEPLDRDDREVAVHGLLEVAARRELAEETGLPATGTPLLPRGYINSDAEDVSSVHFGVVYEVVLDDLPASDADLLAQIAAQAEPHQARWLPVAALAAAVQTGGGPDGGSFEDWSRIVITGGALEAG
jgi:predicted NUDIX family phosphoesterase